ncbi:hypothetical protein Cma02nite_34350 [Cellulomonas marina]|nr:hypothetical protein Cma02nite_34350 [Cellulomonas marina]
MRRFLPVLVAGALAVVTCVPPAAAAASDDELIPGDTLVANQGVHQSALMPPFNERYAESHLEMQSDGNLVLYRLDRYTGMDYADWQTGTSGHPGAYLALQSDGNAVVYTADGGQALWQSGTAGQAGARLTLQPDGNLVVYAGGAARWQAGTAMFRSGLGNAVGLELAPGQDLLSDGAAEVGYEVGHSRLVMQTDGNLVAYQQGRAYWQSGTAGRPGAYLVMQSDGNAVVYASDRATVLWQSGTAGIGDSALTVRHFGSIRISNGIDRITVVPEAPGAGGRDRDCGC